MSRAAFKAQPGCLLPSSFCPHSPLGFVLWCFDFLLLVVFIGVPVVVSAGWTGAASTFFDASPGFVLLSSMVGLGEATCVCGGCAFVFCCGTVFSASVIGSVSPCAASQAGKPPSRARALKPLSRSICAARALVCSCGQEQ